MQTLPDPPAAGDGVAVAAVGLQITVDVKQGNREEFLQAMETLRSRETLPSDQLSSGLFEDRDCPNRFLIIEHWRHPAALDERLRSERFRAMIGALRVLGTIRNISSHSAACLNHLFTRDDHTTIQ